ncbi:hypothetical protein V8G54_022911, partial [Vigna mungo]
SSMYTLELYRFFGFQSSHTSEKRFYIYVRLIALSCNCSFLLSRSSGTIMAYVGIELSSPTLASALINLLPAFTFILALIFRMEEASVAKKYPAITVIIFFQLLSSTMQCGVFALIVVRDPTEWKLNLDIGLIGVLFRWKMKTNHMKLKH